jgi:CBS domain containing-hemolysin-like protein
LATIVIINNAINIVGSIFVGEHVTLLFGNRWLGIASTVITFSIIVVAEIFPKMIGERFRVTISLMVARPIHFLVWMLHPLVVMIIMLTKPFFKGQPLPRVTEEEIKMMLTLGRDAGTVEMDEEVLCKRVFKLNDLRAFQMMKPIERIYAINMNKTLREIKDVIIDSRFSRIAVYDHDPLHIVGIVQHRILLREIAKDNYDVRVHTFMAKPILVNEHIKADALLEKFQAYNQHLFIVQDSQGKHVGLITMEDVLEELFGEIYDEKDSRRRD